MFHRTVALLLVACGGPGAPAQGPKKDDKGPKPPWQRAIAGDDARTAAGLRKQIEAARAAGHGEEAVKRAEELVALHADRQGEDHWQVRDAKRLLAECKRPPLTPGQREKVAEAGDLVSRMRSHADREEDGRAIELARRAADLYREVLGDEDYETNRLRESLAVLYTRQERYEDAEPLLLKALDVFRDLFGDLSPHVANTRSNLGNLYLPTGKLKEAERNYQESVRVFRAVRGDRHPETGASLNNLGMLYDRQGDAAQAEAVYRSALVIFEEAYADRHEYTANCLANLGTLYKSQSRYADAERMYLEAVRIYTRLFTRRHPATARTLIDLAGLYLSQGKYAAAETLTTEAVEVLKGFAGDDHPMLALAHLNLGVLAEDKGDHAGAERQYRTALAIRTKVHGETHPGVAECRGYLAALFDLQGKYDRSEPEVRKCLTIYRETLGPDHLKTVEAVYNLALHLEFQGKFDEAEGHYRTALKWFREHHGADHQFAARTLTALALLQVARGKLAEAEPLLVEAAHSYEAGRLLRDRAVERSVGLQRENPYPYLAAVSARLGKPADGFRALEHDLARGLADEQAARRARAVPAGDRRLRQEAVARLAAIEARVAYLAADPDRSPAVRTELDRLGGERRALGQKLADLSARLSAGEVADPAQIRRALAADEALVAWVDSSLKLDTGSERWACVVRRDGDPKWERLPGTGAGGRWSQEDDELPDLVRWVLRASASADDLDALAKQLEHRPEVVRTIRSAVADPAEARRLFARLDAQRLAPVRKHLAGVKTLYVAATHEMAGIPIDVLTPDYTVAYVPSGTFLTRRGKPSANPAGLLALGDAVYETGKPPVPPGGVLIQQLDPDAGAARAGLRVNDVLLKYGDAAVHSADDLKAAIQAAALGAGEVTLTVWRIDDAGKAADFTRKVPAGPLGVGLAREAAPAAIANRRKADEMRDALRGRGLGDLPGSRYEVARIARLFDRKLVYLDGDASEQVLERLRRSGELAKYRYLHFAAHGEGNAIRAFDSALVLSQDRPAEALARENAPLLDNRVTAAEVLEHWALDADLVTLSACETAVGLSAGGDGLLGFAQAFLLAGSRSVCLSLWKVDDTATALLMARFYENLLGRREGIRRMKKAEALWEAKQWLRSLSGAEALRLGADLRNGVVRGERKNTRDLAPLPKDTVANSRPFADPRYWAAFILVGDPD